MDRCQVPRAGRDDRSAGRRPDQEAAAAGEEDDEDFDEESDDPEPFEDDLPELSDEAFVVDELPPDDESDVELLDELLVSLALARLSVR